MKTYITKLKEYHDLEAHPSIQFDLHLVTIIKTDIVRNEYLKKERMMYMDKYKTEAYILDFYKSNSTIINDDFE